MLASCPASIFDQITLASGKSRFRPKSSCSKARYAAGIREILECWFEGRPIRDEYLIVEGGKLDGVGAYSYSAGDVTHGSEEAAASRGKA